MARIFFTGASGFIGKRLIDRFIANGDEIVAISRGARASGKGINWITGDTQRSGEWQQSVDGCNLVINLAGEPIVGKRWSEAQKRLIRDSRIKTTENIVDAIRQARRRPTTLISASAIGIYAKNEERALDESDPPANDFLGQMCQQWEAAASAVESLGVRLVLPRIGIVLGKEGGALAKMLPPFKLGLGGPVGSGRQWFSWIHIEDMVALIFYAIKHDEMKGPINAVAPHPVRMGEFTKALGRALHRPAFFPVPAFVLKIALGESSQLLLDGQKVVPAVAERLGFNFLFPQVDVALNNLVAQ